MCLESPVRGAVHSRGCKCRKSKFILARRNIFHDFFKAVKICNIVCRISCLLQKRFVVNNTVILNYISNSCHFVSVHQSEAVVCQLPGNIRSGQIIAIILPACQPYRAVYLEQCGSIGLCHFRFQCFLILS